uniref:Uncharacterized protein n=1 Tax=Rhizophora mucronata TaxID=61149 RepID=A0A2P2Q397_RHIMU
MWPGKGLQWWCQRLGIAIMHILIPFIRSSRSVLMLLLLMLCVEHKAKQSKEIVVERVFSFFFHLSF